MTDHDPTGPLDQVTAWLREQKGIGEIPRDLDLVESRVVDSLSFMEFVLLLEDLMGHEIDLDRLSVDQFRTLDAIDANFFSGPSSAHGSVARVGDRG